MKRENPSKFSFYKKIHIKYLNCLNCNHVNVHVDQEKKVVVVEGKFLGTSMAGISKCAPTDTFSIKMGMNLSLYRLLRQVRGIVLAAERRRIKGIAASFDQLTASALKNANYAPREQQKRSNKIHKLDRK